MFTIQVKQVLFKVDIVSLNSLVPHFFNDVNLLLKSFLGPLLV